MKENNIGQSIFTNVIWKFSERIFAQLASIVVSVIVARILCPEDYSVVSIVTIFCAFGNVLVQGGLNTALIQKKDTDEKDYSAVLYVSLSISIVIYVFLFLCAPCIAHFYKQPTLIAIMRVMGIILPINAINSIWSAYISSNMQFRKFFFSAVGGVLISGTLGIAMAMNGFGAWALVVQQLSNALLGTVILIMTTKIKISARFSWKRLRGLLQYGWKVLCTSIIGVLYSELSPIVISIKYSAADLAYYTKGRSFPNVLTVTTTSTLSAVLFPVLSKFQDNKDALLIYTRLFVRQASFISFPIMLGFFAVAENFTYVILTDKWSQVIPYIQIFCLAGMFDVIHIGNCETIKAMGRSDVFLVIEIIKKTAYFIILGLFMWFSNSAQMLALSAVSCALAATIVNSLPNQKLIGYKVSMLIKDMLPNFITALIMVGIVWLVGNFPLGRTYLLITQIIVGIVVYIALNVAIGNESLQRLWKATIRYLKG